MRHRNADFLTAVLEYEHIFYILILADLCKPLRPQINQLAYMRYIKLRQRNRMLWRVENNLALAVRRLGFVKSCFNVIRLGRVLRKSGEVVIVLENVKILRHLVIILAGAERTPVLRHLRSVLTVRCNHNPVLNERIPT